MTSGFANDIYADEMHHLYQRQTDVRNQLKKESGELMKKLSDEIRNGFVPDADLIRLVVLLYQQLSKAKGKKVYGYLKPEVKRTVDAIFSLLSQNENIQRMYALWCEMEQAKHDVYSSAKVDFPPLADNPEFKSVRNIIVKTVASMQLNPPEENEYIFEFEPPPDSENTSDTLPTSSKSKALYESQMISGTIFGLFVNLSRMIQEDYDQSNRKLQSQVDSKLRRIIRRKKMELGIKDDHSPTQNY